MLVCLKMSVLISFRLYLHSPPFRIRSEVPKNKTVSTRFVGASQVLVFWATFTSSEPQSIITIRFDVEALTLRHRTVPLWLQNNVQFHTVFFCHGSKYA